MLSSAASDESSAPPPPAPAPASAEAMPKKRWAKIGKAIEEYKLPREEAEEEAPILPASEGSTQHVPTFIWQRKPTPSGRFPRVQENAPPLSNGEFSVPVSVDEDDDGGGDYYRIPVFHPDGPFHVRWDLIQVVCLTYVSILVPMRLGFNWTAVGLWFVVETLIDLYFFCDIIVNMVTAVRRPTDTQSTDEFAMLEIRKDKILFGYLKSWFLIDLLAFLPVDLAFRAMTDSLWCSYKFKNPCQKENVSDAQILRLFKMSRIFRVLKLFRLVKLKRLFQKYQDALLFWMPVIQASKLFVCLVFAAHWMGCMFASVFPFRQRGINSLMARYVSMVYWAMQTITTVGYGDMVVSRTDCQLVATLAMAIGGLIFGWLIQYVLHVLDPDTYERKQEARIERLVAYLRANKLPLELSTRVIRHVRQQNSRQTEDRIALDNIPQQLRNEVFFHLYSALIRQMPILRGAKTEFIMDLSSKIFPLTIFHGELVYGENDLASEGVYLIFGGQVGLSVTRSDAVFAKQVQRRRQQHRGTMRASASFDMTDRDHEIATLDTGDIFGEGAAFGLARRHDKARAISMVDLLTVTGADFRACIDIVPTLRWRILMNLIEKIVGLSSGNPEIAAELMLDLNLPELMQRQPIRHLFQFSHTASIATIATQTRISAIPQKTPDNNHCLPNVPSTIGLDNFVEFKPDWRELLTTSKRIEWEKREAEARAARASSNGEKSVHSARISLPSSSHSWKHMPDTEQRATQTKTHFDRISYESIRDELRSLRPQFQDVFNEASAKSGIGSSHRSLSDQNFSDDDDDEAAASLSSMRDEMKGLRHQVADLTATLNRFLSAQARQDHSSTDDPRPPEPPSAGQSPPS